uniref:hypothetical protein n=1 Tax=Litorimonas sp. TaxID=1892381 RepID=UPI003A8BD6EE
MEMLAAKMRIWKEYDRKTKPEGEEEGSLGASNASLFLARDKQGKYLMDAPDLYNKTYEYLKKAEAMMSNADALNTKAPEKLIQRWNEFTQTKIRFKTWPGPELAQEI